MRPYIFLSENYLNFTQDENTDPIDIKAVSTTVPYTQTIYFADMYGNITNRTIDTLILQGTNIANMTIEAATEESESESESDDGYMPILTLTNNTDSTVILKAAQPVTTSSIRITIPDDGINPATVSATMGVYGFICNLFALTDSNYKIAANEGNFRTVDGSYIHWADYKKWVAKIQMENLPKDQFDALTAQADKGEMTVIPYTDLEAQAIYSCAVKREYSYELDRKTELFKLDLEFNEL